MLLLEKLLLFVTTAVFFMTSSYMSIKYYLDNNMPINITDNCIQTEINHIIKNQNVIDTSTVYPINNNENLSYIIDGYNKSFVGVLKKNDEFGFVEQEKTMNYNLSKNGKRFDNDPNSISSASPIKYGELSISENEANFKVLNTISDLNLVNLTGTENKNITEPFNNSNSGSTTENNEMYSLTAKNEADIVNINDKTVTSTSMGTINKKSEEKEITNENTTFTDDIIKYTESNYSQTSGIKFETTTNNILNDYKYKNSVKASMQDINFDSNSLNGELNNLKTGFIPLNGIENTIFIATATKSYNSNVTTTEHNVTTMDMLNKNRTLPLYEKVTENKMMHNHKLFNVENKLIDKYLREVDMLNEKEYKTSSDTTKIFIQPFTHDQIILQNKILNLYIQYPILIKHTSILNYIEKFEPETYHSTVKRRILFDILKKYLHDKVFLEDNKDLYVDFCSDLINQYREINDFLIQKNLEFFNMEDFRALYIELIFYKNTCINFSELSKKQSRYEKMVEQSIKNSEKFINDDLRTIEPEMALSELDTLILNFIPKVLPVLRNSGLLEKNIDIDIVKKINSIKIAKNTTRKRQRNPKARNKEISENDKTKYDEKMKQFNEKIEKSDDVHLIENNGTNIN